MADTNAARLQTDFDAERFADALEEYAKRLRDGKGYLQSAESNIKGGLDDYARVSVTFEYVPPEHSNVLQNPVQFQRGEE